MRPAALLLASCQRSWCAEGVACGCRGCAAGSAGKAVNCEDWAVANKRQQLKCSWAPYFASHECSRLADGQKVANMCGFQQGQGKGCILGVGEGWGEGGSGILSGFMWCFVAGGALHVWSVARGVCVVVSGGWMLGVLGHRWRPG